jgi:hypothetical protein
LGSSIGVSVQGEQELELPRLARVGGMEGISRRALRRIGGIKQQRFACTILEEESPSWIR